jgi:hypothetical protein
MGVSGPVAPVGGCGDQTATVGQRSRLRPGGDQPGPRIGAQVLMVSAQLGVIEIHAVHHHMILGAIAMAGRAPV